LWLPIVGVSLTAPVTMHALVSFLMSARDKGFADWCLLSCFLTTHIHITCIVLLVRATMKTFAGLPAATTTQVWQGTTLSALVPISLVMLLVEQQSEVVFIAVAMTFVTTCLVATMGPVFMWPLMSVMRRAAEKERQL
jgi:hypothetical protein